MSAKVARIIVRVARRAVHLKSVVTPRVVLWRGLSVAVFYNILDGQMWLRDYRLDHDVRLTICGHTTEKKEKNWSPIVVDDGQLFLLVYSIDPLVIQV